MTATPSPQRNTDRARAVIRNVWPTGLYFPHSMEIGLELAVTAPGRTPYPAETLHIVSPLTAAQFQPGQWLSVVVDPGNPRRVIITDVLTAPPLDIAP